MAGDFNTAEGPSTSTENLNGLRNVLQFSFLI